VRILRRLLPSQDIDALLGDITEEAPHRSHLWLWGQIAAVIVVGSFRDIRRHPLLALRAVAVGIAVLAVGALMFEPIIRTSLRLSDLVENAWFRSVDRTLLERLNNTAFLVSVTALFYGGLAASGWVVGRLHRRHGITMVLPFATLIALSLVALVIVVRLSATTASQAQVIRSWVDFVKLLAIPVSILLGGYLWTRQTTTA